MDVGRGNGGSVGRSSDENVDTIGISVYDFIGEATNRQS